MACHGLAFLSYETETSTGGTPFVSFLDLIEREGCSLFNRQGVFIAQKFYQQRQKQEAGEKCCAGQVARRRGSQQEATSGVIGKRRKKRRRPGLLETSVG